MNDSALLLLSIPDEAIFPDQPQAPVGRATPISRWIFTSSSTQGDAINAAQLGWPIVIGQESETLQRFFSQDVRLCFWAALRFKCSCMERKKERDALASVRKETR